MPDADLSAVDYRKLFRDVGSLKTHPPASDDFGEENSGWLFDIGDDTTQLYGDYKNARIPIPTNQ